MSMQVDVSVQEIIDAIARIDSEYVKKLEAWAKELNTSDYQHGGYAESKSNNDGGSFHDTRIASDLGYFARNKGLDVDEDKFITAIQTLGFNDIGKERMRRAFGGHQK
jgi:hypothetical protein